MTIGSRQTNLLSRKSLVHGREIRVPATITDAGRIYEVVNKSRNITTAERYRKFCVTLVTLGGRQPLRMRQACNWRDLRAARIAYVAMLQARVAAPRPAMQIARERVFCCRSVSSRAKCQRLSGRETGSAHLWREGCASNQSTAQLSLFAQLRYRK